MGDEAGACQARLRGTLSRRQTQRKEKLPSAYGKMEIALGSVSLLDLLIHRAYTPCVIK